MDAKQTDAINESLLHEDVTDIGNAVARTPLANVNGLYSALEIAAARDGTLVIDNSVPRNTPNATQATKQAPVANMAASNKQGNTQAAIKVTNVVSGKAQKTLAPVSFDGVRFASEKSSDKLPVSGTVSMLGPMSAARTGQQLASANLPVSGKASMLGPKSTVRPASKLASANDFLASMNIQFRPQTKNVATVPTKITAKPLPTPRVAPSPATMAPPAKADDYMAYVLRARAAQKEEALAELVAKADAELVKVESVKVQSINPNTLGNKDSVAAAGSWASPASFKLVTSVVVQEDGEAVASWDAAMARNPAEHKFMVEMWNQQTSELPKEVVDTSNPNFLDKARAIINTQFVEESVCSSVDSDALCTDDDEGEVMVAPPHESLYAHGPAYNENSPKVDICLRPANEADMDDLAEVYNFHVMNGNSTEDLEEVTGEEMRCLFRKCLEERLPLIVAVTELRGKFTKVVGFSFATLVSRGIGGLARCSVLKSRFTAKLSVFVHGNFLRKRIGSCLMDRIHKCLVDNYGGYGNNDYQYGTSSNADATCLDRRWTSPEVHLHKLIVEVQCQGTPQDDEDLSSDNDEELVWKEKWLQSWGYEQKARLTRTGRTECGAWGQTEDDTNVFLDTVIMVREGDPFVEPSY